MYCIIFWLKSIDGPYYAHAFRAIDLVTGTVAVATQVRKRVDTHIAESLGIARTIRAL